MAASPQRNQRQCILTQGTCQLRGSGRGSRAGLVGKLTRKLGISECLTFGGTLNCLQTAYKLWDPHLTTDCLRRGWGPGLVTREARLRRVGGPCQRWAGQAQARRETEDTAPTAVRGGVALGEGGWGSQPAPPAFLRLPAAWGRSHPGWSQDQAPGIRIPPGSEVNTRGSGPSGGITTLPLLNSPSGQLTSCVPSKCGGGGVFWSRLPRGSHRGWGSAQQEPAPTVEPPLLLLRDLAQDAGRATNEGEGGRSGEDPAAGTAGRPSPSRFSRETSHDSSIFSLRWPCLVTSMACPSPVLSPVCTWFGNSGPLPRGSQQLAPL